MKNPKVKINYVSTFGDGFVIGWNKNGIGFGELSFKTTPNGYELDSECMGEEFCKEVFEAFVKKFLKKQSNGK